MLGIGYLFVISAPYNLTPINNTDLGGPRKRLLRFLFVRTLGVFI